MEQKYYTNYMQKAMDKTEPQEQDYCKIKNTFWKSKDLPGDLIKLWVGTNILF